MDLQFEDDTDSLSGLEERILKAVELVSQLKEENAKLRSQLDSASSSSSAATAERERALKELAEAKQTAAAATEELELLRGERKHVRTRIEKLLGQMDLLSSQ
jgi:predicted  nucleic acid-binding Zn-ribbon protein